MSKGAKRSNMRERGGNHQLGAAPEGTLSQEPGGTLPAGLLERDGASWEGRDRGSSLGRAFLQSGRLRPAVLELLPPSRAARVAGTFSCSSAGQGPAPRNRGEEQEEHWEGVPSLAWGNKLATGNRFPQKAPGSSLRSSPGSQVSHRMANA